MIRDLIAEVRRLREVSNKTATDICDEPLVVIVDGEVLEPGDTVAAAFARAAERRAKESKGRKKRRRKGGS